MFRKKPRVVLSDAVEEVHNFCRDAAIRTIQQYENFHQQFGNSCPISEVLKSEALAKQFCDDFSCVVFRIAYAKGNNKVAKLASAALLLPDIGSSALKTDPEITELVRGYVRDPDYHRRILSCIFQRYCDAEVRTAVLPIVELDTCLRYLGYFIQNYTINKH